MSLGVRLKQELGMSFKGVIDEFDEFGVCVSSVTVEFGDVFDEFGDGFDDFGCEVGTRARR